MTGLTVSVTEKAKLTLQRQAAERGMSSPVWAGLVFDMGFAAVCAREKSMPITDRDLDAVVAGTLLLNSTNDWDTDEISRGLGVSEATVVRILDVWRDYRRGGA
jgi:hypothetical protein